MCRFAYSSLVERVEHGEVLRVLQVLRTLLVWWGVEQG
jgi:hypothetical protein